MVYYDPKKYIGVAEWGGVSRQYNADTGEFLRNFSSESQAPDFNQIAHSNNYVYIYNNVTGEVLRFSHDGAYQDTILSGSWGCSGLLVAPDDSYIYLVHVTPAMWFPPFFMNPPDFKYEVYDSSGVWVRNQILSRFISHTGIGVRSGVPFIWAIVSANSVPMDSDYDWWEGRADLGGFDAILPTAMPTLSIPAPIIMRGAYLEDADFAFFVSDTNNICYRVNLTTGNIDSSFDTAASTLFDCACDSDGNLYILGDDAGGPNATLYKYAANVTGSPAPDYEVDLGYIVAEMNQMFVFYYPGIIYETVYVKAWGDDATGDGTITKPFKTISGAVNSISVSGYFLLDVGDINENIAGALDVSGANYIIQLHPNAVIQINQLITAANKLTSWKGGTITITEITT